MEQSIHYLSIVYLTLILYCGASIITRLSKYILQDIKELYTLRYAFIAYKAKVIKKLLFIALGIILFILYVLVGYEIIKGIIFCLTKIL